MKNYEWYELYVRKGGLMTNVRVLVLAGCLGFIGSLLALAGPISITDIDVVSGNPYEDGGIVVPGAPVYVDEDVTFSDVPAEIAGGQYIKGWNQDAEWLDVRPPLKEIFEQYKNFLSFTIDGSVHLWILHDGENDDQLRGWCQVLAAAVGDPAQDAWLWAKDESGQLDFIDTGIDVPVSDNRSFKFTLYQGTGVYASGQPITLGSLGGKGKVQYVVVVTPTQLPVQPGGILSTTWSALKVVP